MAKREIMDNNDKKEIEKNIEKEINKNKWELFAVGELTVYGNLKAEKREGDSIVNVGCSEVLVEIYMCRIDNDKNEIELIPIHEKHIHIKDIYNIIKKEKQMVIVRENLGEKISDDHDVIVITDMYTKEENTYLTDVKLYNIGSKGTSEIPDGLILAVYYK